MLITKSAGREGHIALISALVIGNTEKTGVQRVYSHPFVKREDSNIRKAPHRQDLVFVRLPGAADGGFRLSIDNVWFCKVLLLFSFESRTDSGTKDHECALVSVQWEYNGAERPGSNIL